MKYIDREKIYSDPKLLQHLRDNSIWYKNLNRRISVDIMTNEMKEKYGLRFKDKVEKIGTGMDLINAFMSVTKD